MSLSHRPTTPQDLEACLPLIRNGFAFGLAERPHLLALWRHLLDKGITESTVIEERTGPTGSRIVGFGLSIFVTDEFAEDSRTRLPPYQARHVLERWCQGKPPFLNAAQIRRANSGSGLNVVVLHHGWENTDGGKTPSPEISLKIYEAFYAHHIGYHLRHFQHEVYGEWQAVFVRRTMPPPPRWALHHRLACIPISWECLERRVRTLITPPMLFFCTPRRTFISARRSRIYCDAHYEARATRRSRRRWPSRPTRFTNAGERSLRKLRKIPVFSSQKAKERDAGRKNAVASCLICGITRRNSVRSVPLVGTAQDHLMTRTVGGASQHDGESFRPTEFQFPAHGVRFLGETTFFDDH
jgi:hypothetical protein